MKNLNFSIPKPCTQDFSKMKKSDKGRYCESCAKHVVDFSYKSKEEIIDYLVQKQGQEVCGTFQKNQLQNKRIYNSKRSFSFDFLCFLVIAFLTNTLISCKVYKPRGGPVLGEDNKGKGSGRLSANAEDHLESIRKTCPPDNVLGGAVVIAIHPPDPKKDSVIIKDTIAVTKKILSDTTFIHFPSNKYELDKTEQTLLISFANKLKMTPTISLAIAGYTDGTGSIFTNQIVSRRRAEAVRAFLRDQKVTNTIVIKAYGIKNPVASNDTEAGKALNRRAEIIILKE